MPGTAGFFQPILDPEWRAWMEDERLFYYIQKEVARRLKQKYIEYIEVPIDTVKVNLLHTKEFWRGPLNLDELLEMTIYNLTSEIDTDLENLNNRFHQYNPRTLYFGFDGITKEEKIKMK